MPVQVFPAPGAAHPLIGSAGGSLDDRRGGRIDRIDVGGGGRRAFLYDYKTGRSDGYKPLQDDPVIAGQALQLALYAEVARRNLGDPDIEAAYWFISSRGGFTMEGLRQPAD